MQAVGLITEYNPLHNGHLYHLRQAKKLTQADCSVVVMSGNWLQRGEPALLDKWTRTQLALEAGVDLVVELPVFYATQPAHLFARGGVEILTALGCESLVFGTEHPELDFERLLTALPKTKAAFKHYNATYASQFNSALQQTTGVSLTHANDMLSFCYYLANQQFGEQLRLVPIKRQVAVHSDDEIQPASAFASGTAIRTAAMLKKWDQVQAVVPAQTLKQLQTQRLQTWDDFWPYLQYQLLTASVTQTHQIDQMAEGLEYRMKEMVQAATSFEDLMTRAKSKRYTYTRLQRVATAALLQLTAAEVQTAQMHNYVRVLGFSPAGQAYLHQVKKQLSLPLYTKINKELRLHGLALDYRAGRVYELVTGQSQDLYRRPIRVLE